VCGCERMREMHQSIAKNMHVDTWLWDYACDAWKDQKNTRMHVVVRGRMKPMKDNQKDMHGCVVVRRLMRRVDRQLQRRAWVWLWKDAWRAWKDSQKETTAQKDAHDIYSSKDVCGGMAMRGCIKRECGVRKTHGAWGLKKMPQTPLIPC